MPPTWQALKLITLAGRQICFAAVLGAEHEWDEQQTSEMLEDENATSFLFSDDSFAWREWKIATDRIKTRRELVISFGSCSFDEPREDLRALRLLRN
jgi:hypothetical protein